MAKGTPATVSLEKAGIAFKLHELIMIQMPPVSECRRLKRLVFLRRGCSRR